MKCWLLLKRACASAVLMASVALVQAEDYLSGEQFLASAFTDASPEQKTLWITNDIRQRAQDSIGVVPSSLRMRYWSNGVRTAWVLEQIGKEQPITLGIVIEAEHIVDVRVMSFRESRGGEIRYPFFTAQYQGVALSDGRTLSRDVDGITGATLSVKAVNRAARLALWLNAQALASVATR